MAENLPKLLLRPPLPLRLLLLRLLLPLRLLLLRPLLLLLLPLRLLLQLPLRLLLLLLLPQSKHQVSDKKAGASRLFVYPLSLR